MPKTKEKEEKDKKVKEKDAEERSEFEEFDPDSDQIRIPVSEEDETQRIEEVLGIPLGEVKVPEGVEVREEKEQTAYSPEQTQEEPSYGPSTEYGGTNYSNDQYQAQNTESNVAQGGLERLVPTAGASKDEVGKQQGYLAKETGRTDIDRDLLDRDHWKEGRKKKPRV